MNFKESYKKANDEIEGDKALLEKILSTPVKEKTKITPIVYKTASLAAAFVLILTVALMPQIKEKIFVNKVPVSEAVAEDIEEAVSEESAEVSADSAGADDDAVTFSVKRAEDLKEAENASINIETKETVPETAPLYDVAVVNEANNEVVAYSGEEVAEVEMTSETTYDSNENGIALTSGTEAAPIAEESIVAKTKITSGGGGGAPARSKNTASDIMEKSRSEEASKVLVLIGLNPETLEFNGMDLTYPEPLYAEFSEEGNVLAYGITVFLEKDTAKMTVFLTDSVTPLAFSVTEEEGVISASKTLNDTDIHITAYNMTKDEVEEYINSIA